MEKIVESITEKEDKVEFKINLSPLRKKVKELNELGMMVTDAEMIAMLEKKLKGSKLDVADDDGDNELFNHYTWVISKKIMA